MAESRLAAMIRHAGSGAALIALLAREIGRTPTAEELFTIYTTWQLIARPEQLAPLGDWDIWLVLAGRGFGKTRTGAEWVKDQVESGRCRRIALVAPTLEDARKVMVEGESGIMSLYAHVPESERPVYEPSLKQITWPNGAVANLYSAEKPDRLRGPQHDGAWCDELASWATTVPKKDRQAAIVLPGRPPAWDMLLLGLRLGEHPRVVVTTTPRPIPLLRELIRDPKVVTTKGTTYDNAPNLAPPFLRAILKAYEGTRLGQQEIHAQILDDNPNALWKAAQIEKLRIPRMPLDAMLRIAVAIDPAVSSNPDSDMTGIVAGGLVEDCGLLPSCPGNERHAVILEDKSAIHTYAEWALEATNLYKVLEADRIIGEVNNGGDLVEANLRAYGDKEVSASAAYRAVHASRGKYVRAEPVAALTEQGKVHHYGNHPQLEDELTQWDPKGGFRSPSRLDAYVWLLTDLMLGEAPARADDDWGSVLPRRA